MYTAEPAPRLTLSRLSSRIQFRSRPDTLVMLRILAGRLNLILPEGKGNEQQDPHYWSRSVIAQGLAFRWARILVMPALTTPQATIPALAWIAEQNGAEAGVFFLFLMQDVKSVL
jgi:hypothetical protein